MTTADLEGGRWRRRRRRLLFIPLRMHGQGREAERGDKDQGGRGGADQAKLSHKILQIGESKRPRLRSGDTSPIPLHTVRMRRGQMNYYIEEVIGPLGGVIHLDDRCVESLADFLLGLLQLQPGGLRRLDL